MSETVAGSRTGAGMAAQAIERPIKGDIVWVGIQGPNNQLQPTNAIVQQVFGGRDTSVNNLELEVSLMPTQAQRNTLQSGDYDLRCRYAANLEMGCWTPRTRNF